MGHGFTLGQLIHHDLWRICAKGAGLIEAMVYQMKFRFVSWYQFLPIGPRLQPGAIGPAMIRGFSPTSRPSIIFPRPSKPDVYFWFIRSFVCRLYTMR
jgi:hypothetical protein